MKKKIMLVTGSHDVTCDYIQHKFPTKSFFRLNLDQFSDYRLVVRNGAFEIQYGQLVIHQEDCRSIYFRKPIFENLDRIFEQQYHSFAHRETFSAIEGIIESFTGPCLSKPSSIRRANNKIFQLFLAEKVGFNLPISCITNSVAAVHNLGSKPIIVKPLAIGTVEHSSRQEYVQTNLVNKEIPFDSLRYAPSYFQEYITKDYEVRATFIRGEAHAVRIDSENQVDWRKRGNKVNYSPYKLPQHVYQTCLEFMEQAEMEFGCFDFIVSNGEFIFLEMNANGQWAWLEKVEGCNVAQSIIEYLDEAN